MYVLNMADVHFCENANNNRRLVAGQGRRGFQAPAAIRQGMAADGKPLTGRVPETCNSWRRR